MIKIKQSSDVSMVTAKILIQRRMLISWEPIIYVIRMVNLLKVRVRKVK